MNSSDSERSRHLRRSTRVPIHVRIELQARAREHACDAETVVVNLHGALLRTSEPLEVGERVKLHVSLTGKIADARVVFADPDQPMHFGLALDQAENIWGISLPPEDWEERTSDVATR